MNKNGCRIGHQLSSALLLCFLAIVMASAATAAATGESGVHKVVIQVSTGDAQVQRMALNNAANLQERFGADNVQIEIVTYGPGLGLVTAKRENSARVERMAMEGIRFSACHNTMEGIKRKTGHLPDLSDGVQVVPSGIARIVILQEQGYAYVRP